MQPVFFRITPADFGFHFGRTFDSLLPLHAQLPCTVALEVPPKVALGRNETAPAPRPGPCTAGALLVC